MCTEVTRRHLILLLGGLSNNTQLINAIFGVNTARVQQGASRPVICGQGRRGGQERIAGKKGIRGKEAGGEERERGRHGVTCLRVIPDM